MPAFFDTSKGDRQVNFPMTLFAGQTGSDSLASISGVGINPGATGVDNVLAAFTIPAGAFAAANNGCQVTALGTFANNTNSKRTKIIINPATAVVGSTVGAGGVTIADTGAFTTAAAVTWVLAANVFKYGAFGSNTQIGLCVAQIIAATAVALLAPVAITAVESGAILVAITGNAGTTASDIALYQASIEPIA